MLSSVLQGLLFAAPLTAAWLYVLANGMLGAATYALPLGLMVGALVIIGLYRAALCERRALLSLLVFTAFFLNLSFRQREHGELGLDWQNGVKIVTWVVLLGVSMVNLHRIARLVADPVIGLIFCFGAFALLSAAYSPVPAYSAVGAIGFLTYMSFACLVAGEIKARPLVTALVWTLAVYLGVNWVFAAIVPGTASVPLHGEDSSYRMAGLAGHPNNLAKQAALLICLALVARRRGYLGRISGWALLALGVVTVLATGSRTAAVAVALACGLVVLRRRLPLRTTLALGLLLGVLVLMGSVGTQFDLDAFLRMFSRAGDEDEVLTLTGRTELWSFTWEKILERPFLGYGFISFEAIMTREWFGAEDAAVGAHNSVLQALFTVGFIGTLPFLGAMLILLWRWMVRPDALRDVFTFYLLVSGITEVDIVALPTLQTLVAFCAFALDTAAVSTQASVGLVRPPPKGDGQPRIAARHVRTDGAGPWYRTHCAGAWRTIAEGQMLHLRPPGWSKLLAFWVAFLAISSGGAAVLHYLGPPAPVASLGMPGAFRDNDVARETGAQSGAAIPPATAPDRSALHGLGQAPDVPRAVEAQPALSQPGAVTAAGYAASAPAQSDPAAAVETAASWPQHGAIQPSAEPAPNRVGAGTDLPASEDVASPHTASVATGSASDSAPTTSSTAPAAAKSPLAAMTEAAKALAPSPSDFTPAAPRSTTDIPSADPANGPTEAVADGPTAAASTTAAPDQDQTAGLAAPPPVTSEDPDLPAGPADRVAVEWRPPGEAAPASRPVPPEQDRSIAGAPVARTEPTPDQATPPTQSASLQPGPAEPAKSSDSVFPLPYTPTAGPVTAVQAASQPAILAAFLQRGDAMFTRGDISAARLLYERAVAFGSAHAATALGKTYDPEILTKMGTIGIRPDPATAAIWYRRAAALGDNEATVLLRPFDAGGGR